MHQSKGNCQGKLFLPLLAHISYSFYHSSQFPGKVCQNWQKLRGKFTCTQLWWMKTDTFMMIYDEFFTGMDDKSFKVLISNLTICFNWFSCWGWFKTWPQKWMIGVKMMTFFIAVVEDFIFRFGSYNWTQMKARCLTIPKWSISFMYLSPFSCNRSSKLRKARKKSPIFGKTGTGQTRDHSSDLFYSETVNFWQKSFLRVLWGFVSTWSSKNIVLIGLMRPE